MKPKTKSALRWVVVYLLLCGTLIVFLAPVREEPGYYAYDVPTPDFFNGCGTVTLVCPVGACPYGIENRTASGVYNVRPANRGFNVFGWDLGVEALTCL